MAQLLLMKRGRNDQAVVHLFDNPGTQALLDYFKRQRLNANSRLCHNVA